MSRYTELQESLGEFEFPDGVYPVLTTPFTKDGFVDILSLEKCLAAQYRSPTVGLVMLGTTSESPTLTEDEKITIAEYVYNYNNLQGDNRKFLVVGVGGNCTRNVLSFAKKVEGFCNAFMATVPNYNKPQQRGVIDLFQQVSKNFPKKPIMMYNIPGRTAIDMAPESMVEVLKTCPNVSALKEASGNYVNVEHLVQLIEDESLRDLSKTFKLFSGDDVNAVTLCENHKGRGVISVAGNIIPGIMCDMMDKCLAGKFEDAQAALDKSRDFIKYLFVESNPVPIKNILHQAEMIENDTVRRPLMEMNDEQKTKRLWELFFSLIPKENPKNN